MESNPLVSIAIVTWNRRDDVLNAVESACNQTHKNIEIVIVDNASTDGTYESLRQNYPQAKVIKTHRNLGICPSRNIAMANCTGEIIFCLDDDVLMDDQCLERIVMDLQRNEEVAIVACNILDPSEIERTSISKSGETGNSYVPIFISAGAFGIKRELMVGAGYFPDYFRQGEENYLSLRIADAGYKILFEPAAIVYHEWVFGEKGRNERQILALNFRHELENIKRLLPTRYALPLMPYRILVNLAKRYLIGGRVRYFIPDLIKVLPVFIADYKEPKIKVSTYRWFTMEASKFFKDRDSYEYTPMPQTPAQSAKR